MQLNYVLVLLITILFIFGSSGVRCQSTLDSDDICKDGEWRCTNGSCIALGKRCDGRADCADASDESFITCRLNSCPADAFRCAYGACVNGSAPCNTKQDCFDNSDEALTKCLPETARTQCDMTTLSGGRILFSCFIQTNCDNGQLLSESDRCDGKVDCTDGSDETIARCTETRCPEDTFRCAYGGCAHKFAQCNGIVDCADGSDESDELCGRLPTPKPPVDEPKPGPTPSGCVLPPYPQNGTYTVPGRSLSPGEIVDTTYMNYTCTPPYKIVGKNFLYCNHGVWSGEFPSCKLYCKLDKHISVEYRCLLSGSRSLRGSRICGNEEPSGITVKPVCRGPNFYYPGVLPYMRCEEGNWDSVATCIPECGRTTPSGMKLVSGGRQAIRDELPWHAAIYAKNPYRQICGGTVLTTAVILSAAHCFWTNGALQPFKNYAVAVGKLNIEWGHTNDTDAQTSDVLDIKIPPRYQGSTGSFQDDIAVVILSTPLQYTVHVRPACLDFDFEFDSRQLRDGNLGKVAGWGLTSENGGPSPVLKVVDLPYVPIDRCLEESPFEFQGYITTDKICAGYTNGTAVCKGDSGGGLTFPELERSVKRHFLRGVVSTAPRGDHDCNVDAVTTFTRVVKHHHFIRRHLTGI